MQKKGKGERNWFSPRASRSLVLISLYLGRTSIRKRKEGGATRPGNATVPGRRPTFLKTHIRQHLPFCSHTSPDSSLRRARTCKDGRQGLATSFRASSSPLPFRPSTASIAQSMTSPSTTFHSEPQPFTNQEIELEVLTDHLSAQGDLPRSSEPSSSKVDDGSPPPLPPSGPPETDEQQEEDEPIPKWPFICLILQHLSSYVLLKTTLISISLVETQPRRFVVPQVME